eukprot:GHVL01008842.1.p1 GENE.GHVL01008842.1~~GHVL01008842.1.p1  ORF type:complete len:498 (+),score=104.33 GHVL01008842.1:60-1553(+)
MIRYFFKFLIFARYLQAFQYDYRTYLEILLFFEDLNSEYPDLVELWIAQDEFKDVLGDSFDDLICENTACKHLIVRITNEKLLNEHTPEVYLSGAVHGNERLGPNAVTELSGFLTKNYEKSFEIQYLLDNRAIYITPTTNAYGYANNVREERGVDPNRDFPYKKPSSKCMQTVTARVVNELFRRHNFRLGITFHGGMRSLSGEWGSFNHMKSKRSTECPDNEAQLEISMKLIKSAGKDDIGNSWYTYAPTNDIVYPVDGGMEDWAYAASWDSSAVKHCTPETYGGYPSERTDYNGDGSARCLLFLAEMDDLKTPPSASLGFSTEMWKASTSDGHIARNMRLALKLIELASPDIIFASLPLHTLQPGESFEFDFYGSGCLNMSDISLILLKGSCDTIGGNLTVSSKRFYDGNLQDLILDTKINDTFDGYILKRLTDNMICRGLGVWEEIDDELLDMQRGLIKMESTIPTTLPLGEYCGAIVAEFDPEFVEVYILLINI